LGASPSAATAASGTSAEADAAACLTNYVTSARAANADEKACKQTLSECLRSAHRYNGKHCQHGKAAAVAMMTETVGIAATGIMATTTMALQALATRTVMTGVMAIHVSALNSVIRGVTRTRTGAVTVVAIATASAGTEAAMRTGART
jgi:hypothetical protein